MNVIVPDYYDDFRCLAGACPHSCCVGWEVVIDEETALYYKTVDGALGEKLRNSMEMDSEGDCCFPLKGGRCPFLDGENLCEIHRTLGEEATSVTCREHPRFLEDYGSRKEISLSASCPAANALLLQSREPLHFLIREVEGKEEDCDALLPLMITVRDRMLDLLRDREKPMKRRLWEFLLFAMEAQALLEEEWLEELGQMPEKWTVEDTAFSDVGQSPELFPECLRFLGRLEVLEPEWNKLLLDAERVETIDTEEVLLERIAVYFGFRYLLKAINDDDLLSRAALCVLSVLVVDRLSAVCGIPEAMRHYCREIQHNEDNVEALLQGIWQEEALSCQSMLRILARE